MAFVLALSMIPAGAVFADEPETVAVSEEIQTDQTDISAEADADTSVGETAKIQESGESSDLLDAELQHQYGMNCYMIQSSPLQLRRDLTAY